MFQASGRYWSFQTSGPFPFKQEVVLTAMDYSFKTHLVPKTFGTQSSYTRQTTIRQQADDERTPTIQEIDNKRVRSRLRTDEERIRNRQGTDEALFTKWAPRKTWLHPPQKHSAAITSGENRRRNFGRVAWSNQGVRENFRSIYLIFLINIGLYEKNLAPRIPY